MSFTYQNYRSPLTDSIAARIANQGAIEAQRAQQTGNAWAGAVQNIGQAVAAIPGQMEAQKRAGLQDQLLAGQVADMNQARQGQAAVDSMMRGDQLPAGDVGPRQQSYLDANGLFDIQKMTQEIGKSGLGHMAPELLKGAEAINDSILKHQQLEQQANQQHAIMLGDAAAGALKLADAGTPIPQAMDFVVQPFLATKRFKPEEYAQVKAQIASLPPEQQRAALTALMDQAAKLDKGETLAKDSERLDRYGRVVATNKAPEKPVSVAPGASLVNPQTGQPIYTAPARPSPLQSKSVMVDGKPVEAVFDPAKGTLSVNGVDVTAKARPIPPASVTIHNDAAAAVAGLPDWALDASRPAPGPDGNKIDPKVRMTPNGLYQAATNYISTGQMPPTGRGNDPAAQAVRTAVNSKAGAIAAEAGMDIPALRAFYKSNAASLAQQQKAADAVQSFMATADRNADLLEQTLAKIPDAGVPAFNGPIRDLSKKFAGNANVSQFATYLQSVQNEYARIIAQPNLAGQLTDSARHEAEQLLDPNATVKQIVASVQALKNEGNNRLLSIGEQIQRIQGRMNAGAGATPPAGGGGLVTMRAPNGQTKQVSPSEVAHYQALGATVVK